MWFQQSPFFPLLRTGSDIQLETSGKSCGKKTPFLSKETQSHGSKTKQVSAAERAACRLKPRPQTPVQSLQEKQVRRGRLTRK